MLVHRIRRHPNIKTTLTQRLVFAGDRLTGLSGVEMFCGCVHTLMWPLINGRRCSRSSVTCSRSR